MKMGYYKRITCCSGCAEGLREDRRQGLIYGPYCEGDDEDGKPKLISMERFAALTESCIYCRSPLPRGRGKRLLKGLEERKAA